MPNKKPTNDKELVIQLFHHLGVSYDTWYNSTNNEEMLTLVPYTHRKVEGSLSAEVEFVFDDAGSFLRIDAHCEES